MRLFFAPIVALMDRLSFFKKFTLIFILFVIPLAASLNYLNKDLGKRVMQKEEQAAGIEYNAAVRALIKDVQQHRGMASSYLNGDDSFKQKLVEKQAVLKQEEETINQLLEKHSETLSAAGEWKEIEKGLDALVGSMGSINASQSFARHSELVAMLLSLTEQVADHTNLMLQDDLEKYYLVDEVTLKLPRISEAMGQGRALGSGIAAKGKMTPEEKEKFAELAQLMQSLKKDAEKGFLAARGNELIQAETEGSYEKAMQSVESLAGKINEEFLSSNEIKIDSQEYFAYATAAIDDVYDLLEKSSALLDEISRKDADKMVEQKERMMASTAIVCALILYLFIGFYQAIINNIRRMRDVATKVAEGDLTLRADIKAKDEIRLIAEALNSMADSFSRMVNNSKVLADNVSGSSKELRGIVEITTESTAEMTKDMLDTSEASAEQFESTREISGAMGHVSESVHLIAQNSMGVAMSSKEMELDVQEGSISMKDLFAKMESVKVFVDESNEIIQSLGERSKSIGQIIDSISAISHQTNILALNAAIEAARAGEYGKGFSVVAEEVKALADQSKKSTDQISNMITNIQKDTLESVDRMHKIKAEVEEGFEEVRNTDKVFKKISNSTEVVSDQIQGISAATEEISASAEEITAQLSEVSNTSARNMRVLKTVADNSNEQLNRVRKIFDLTALLEARAKELDQEICRYKI